MGLKERINRISAYFRGIDYADGWLMIKVAYPPKITPTESEDGLIKYTYSEEEGLWYYYAEDDLVDENAIFDLIEETVKVYEEAKQKVTLMKEKMEELKEVFASNSLEHLKTLYFGFTEPTNTMPSKRKYTKKKKENEIKEIKEEGVE